MFDILLLNIVISHFVVCHFVVHHIVICQILKPIFLGLTDRLNLKFGLCSIAGQMFLPVWK
jgi:hypothetical protein